MNKLFRNLIAGVLFLFQISACNVSSDSFTIAVSGNAAEVMKEISIAFEKKEHTKVNIAVASSGKIAGQIIAGAPFDLFFSADKSFPDSIYNRNLAETVPEVYAIGQLLIWSKKDSIISLQDIDWTKIETVGIANPKTAPYGKAAVEVLKRLGVYDKINNKLIVAESVSQLNNYIYSQNVDFAITALSLKYSGTKIEGFLYVPENDFQIEIEQAFVILKSETKNKLSDKFIEFVHSQEAAAIFIKYGYKLPLKL